MSRPGAPLWIIDPSTHRAEDQGVAEVRRDWPGDSRLFRPVLSPGDGPVAGDGYEIAGVVLLGSAASVHDTDPWLGELAGWLRPILTGERRLPLLGVCFGHQLIAHLAGGEVGFIDAEKTKRLGVEFSQLEPCRLFPEPQELRVVVSHREEVKSCPRGFRVVARREGVEIDGLEHEQLPLWSYQFHPEARDEFAVASGIDPAQIDERLRRDSRSLLDAFLQRCS